MFQDHLTAQNGFYRRKACGVPVVEQKPTGLRQVSCLQFDTLPFNFFTDSSSSPHICLLISTPSRWVIRFDSFPSIHHIISGDAQQMETMIDNGHINHSQTQIFAIAHSLRLSSYYSINPSIASSEFPLHFLLSPFIFPGMFLFVSYQNLIAWWF